MKALTISQPYASLIATGEKWVENRRWQTDYRGQLAIHAGKGEQYLTKAAADARGLPRGGVVAVATLVAVCRLPVLRMTRRSKPVAYDFPSITVGNVLDHIHTEGPVCWVLHDVRPLSSPVMCKGAQGIWEWDVDPVEVERMLAGAES